MFGAAGLGRGGLLRRLSERLLSEYIRHGLLLLLRLLLRHSHLLEASAKVAEAVTGWLLRGSWRRRRRRWLRKVEKIWG